jgi:hypothetical protein
MRNSFFVVGRVSFVRGLIGQEACHYGLECCCSVIGFRVSGWENLKGESFRRSRFELGKETQGARVRDSMLFVRTVLRVR